MNIKNVDVLEYLATIETESIDCVVTDPPYKIIASGVKIVDDGTEPSGILNKRKMVSDGTACSNKWLKKKNKIACAVKQGKMFGHNDIKFSAWLPEIYRVLKKGTHAYIMINSRNLKELQNEAEKVGFVFQNLLVWVKGNYTPNKYYMQGAEFILLLSKRPARSINNMGATNIINIPNIIGNKQHPTEKPVELMKYFIENSTNPKDKVLDPFLGSGSTAVACNELNRKIYGCEIDKEYYNISLYRNFSSLTFFPAI